MKKELRQKYNLFLINSIMEKSINPHLKGLDIFVNYSGHVNQIDVRIIKDCDYDEEADHNLIFQESVYLDENNSSEQLNKILTEMEFILEGNNP